MAKRFWSSMRRIPARALLTLLVCAFVALAPGLAEARAGSSIGRGMSWGSRGARTYQYNGGQAIGRSTTPRLAPPRSSFGSPYGYGYGGGFFSQHPFLGGLMGGMFGAGLAGMLFGHWGWGYSPFGMMLGMLFQFGLIAALIWFALTAFRRRAGLVGAGGLGLSGLAGGYARSGRMGGGAPRDPIEIPIDDADFNTWSGLLGAIQSAWSRGDLGAMRQHATPEMLSYFSEELSRNASQGVENRVEQVSLVKGDLLEAWREGDLDYATARLRWTAVDYMVRPPRHPGEHEIIVGGDPVHPIESAEIWTFMRSRGGQWLLAAIQQV